MIGGDNIGHSDAFISQKWKISSFHPHHALSLPRAPHPPYFSFPSAHNIAFFHVDHFYPLDIIRFYIGFLITKFLISLSSFLFFLSHVKIPYEYTIIEILICLALDLLSHHKVNI